MSAPGGSSPRGLDYAFSDEHTPDGWPELDFAEMLLGEWQTNKKPSSAAARRFLTETAYFLRAGLPRTDARELYRKSRVHYVKIEASIVGVREKMLPDWKLWCTRAQGGVQ